MAVQIQGQVGPQVASDGSNAEPRLGKSAELVVQELHGRFYEQAYRGSLFSSGMTLTSISAATFTTSTLGATGTPIAGVYNPLTSPVNLVILQAALGVTVTAGTATGGAPFVWAASFANGGLTAAGLLIPFGRKTLQQIGSFAKGLAGIAMTGQDHTLVVMGASALTGGLIKNTSSVETAVGQNIGIAGTSVENLDGSIIVPPGGILGLFATTTPVAHSAASLLLWEEVPL